MINSYKFWKTYNTIHNIYLRKTIPQVVVGGGNASSESSDVNDSKNVKPNQKPSWTEPKKSKMNRTLTAKYNASFFKDILPDMYTEFFIQQK